MEMSRSPWLLCLGVVLQSIVFHGHMFVRPEATTTDSPTLTTFKHSLPQSLRCRSATRLRKLSREHMLGASENLWSSVEQKFLREQLELRTWRYCSFCFLPLDLVYIKTILDIARHFNSRTRSMNQNSNSENVSETQRSMKPSNRSSFL